MTSCDKLIYSPKGEWKLGHINIHAIILNIFCVLQAKRDIYSKKVTSIKENEDAEYDPFINRVIHLIKNR